MKGVAERDIDDIYRQGHIDIFRVPEFETGNVESMIAACAANHRALIFMTGEMFPEFFDSDRHYLLSKSACAAIETRSSR